MENIKFEDLPATAARIDEKLNLLLARFDALREQDEKPIRLNIKQAAEYLGRTPNALRIATHRGEIPHIKQRNRLYFLRHELDAWLEAGRIRTVEEIQEEAMKGLKEPGK